MSKQIFVGAPYSGDPKGNIAAVKRYVAQLIDCGYIVHVPMITADAVYVEPDVADFSNRDWELWTEKYIAISDEAHFLKLPGFEQSSGVANELEICSKLGKKITIKEV